MTDASFALAASQLDDPLQTVEACLTALQHRQTTSAALVETVLARIERTQPTLNCFRIVCADSARQEAEEADRRRASGEALPLLGVPIAVKDDVALKGLPTAFGCVGEFPPAPEDSELVGRLRAAGAVIVGKTNSPEIGLYPFTEGEAFGATRNPWDLDRTPGGSSGGSAAAVAAGIVPAAFGSDGAGSVRIPAAWCGLVGVKPQRGRVSTWPERDAFSGLVVYGPLTRTVSDAALLLDVVGGAHPEDVEPPARHTEPFLRAIGRDPGPLRIGIALNAPLSGVRVKLDPEIRAGVERIAEVLESLGHVTVSSAPRYRLMGLSLLTRGESGVYEWSKQIPDQRLVDLRTRKTIKVGGRLSKRALPLARRLERRQARRLGAAFEQVDVLLAPTTATAPLAIGASEGLGTWGTQRLISAACPYAWPWNLVGWPAISVPAGLTRSGLPFGAQLIGQAGSEALLLALAAQLERAERWEQRRPPHMATDPDRT